MRGWATWPSDNASRLSTSSAETNPRPRLLLTLRVPHLGCWTRCCDPRPWPPPPAPQSVLAITERTRARSIDSSLNLAPRGVLPARLLRRPDSPLFRPYFRPSTAPKTRSTVISAGDAVLETKRPSFSPIPRHRVDQRVNPRHRLPEFHPSSHPSFRSLTIKLYKKNYVLPNFCSTILVTLRCKLRAEKLRFLDTEQTTNWFINLVVIERRYLNVFFYQLRDAIEENTQFVWKKEHR